MTKKVSGLVVVDGITKTRLEWCEYYGITSAVLNQRMRQHGISLEDAIRMGGRRGSAVKAAKAAKEAAKAAIPMPDVPLKPCANDSAFYVTEDGRVWNDKSKRWVAVFPHSPNPGKPHKKYLRVRVGGRERYVQTVVAEAWVDNPANLPWVWHKDGDLLNNHKDNLVWATIQDVHEYRKEMKERC